MRGRIPEEKIQDIRERTDIVEVISSYLPLKRSGANHLGLCPFHGEKTPSFNVNAPRQIFHCFGCGVGGNVFSFVMKMEGLSFPEAARQLGERVGIEIAEEAVSPEEEERRVEADRLARINEVACDFYHQILLESPEGGAARRYLRDRGYDGEIARRFRLGFAPERWEALAGHLAAKGFDPALGRQLGLIRPGKEGRSDYDLFRKRLLFPILDLAGRVTAFGGRVLDDSLPKYMNSPESPIYHKGRVLFGLCEAREGMRQRREGIVVEGYFDQMALYRAGFTNAVATCGTALTVEHARLLKRYAERLLLLFDQDSAGRKATFRAMEVLLAEGIPASVVALEPGEDPDSFLRLHGVDDFSRRLEAARPVLEVYMETVLAEHGASIEGTTRAVDEILARLRLIPGEIERSLYLRALAARTGIAEDLIRRQAEKGGPANRPVLERAPQAPRPQTAVAPPRHRREGPTRDIKTQEWLLVMMLSDPTIRARVAEEGPELLFSDDDRRAIAEGILALSGEDGSLSETILLDSLGEEQKAILSGILIKDEKAFADDPAAIFEGCRQAAALERIRRRIRELPAILAAAEAAGDLQGRTACQAELVELKRKLKK
ncbi:DNA primase, catalytic core [Desulfuromonas soudanensis]|uniref:DNA primase n=1 Tax=Desulfuromonas soudanensis TaxID=1603606 RepID=A0A0M3QGF9_9BACT|nr:DNA primase [Desulfuromonas soudanensis]ALC17909.1 DNA primase, catalytic core [Desulfuromonas soudanensis]